MTRGHPQSTHRFRTANSARLRTCRSQGRRNLVNLEGSTKTPSTASERYPGSMSSSNSLFRALATEARPESADRSASSELTRAQESVDPDDALLALLAEERQP